MRLVRNADDAVHLISSESTTLMLRRILQGLQPATVDSAFRELDVDADGELLEVVRGVAGSRNDSIAGVQATSLHLQANGWIRFEADGAVLKVACAVGARPALEVVAAGVGARATAVVAGSAVDVAAAQALDCFCGRPLVLVGRAGAGEWLDFERRDCIVAKRIRKRLPAAIAVIGRTLGNASK